MGLGAVAGVGLSSASGWVVLPGIVDKTMEYSGGTGRFVPQAVKTKEGVQLADG
jgi:hypothetical protein